VHFGEHNWVNSRERQGAVAQNVMLEQRLRRNGKANANRAQGVASRGNFFSTSRAKRLAPVGNAASLNHNVVDKAAVDATNFANLDKGARAGAHLQVFGACNKNPSPMYVCLADEISHGVGNELRFVRIIEVRGEHRP
jgi:hypothetical protein